MKRTLSSIAAAAMVLGTLSPSAFAATGSSTSYSDIAGNFASTQIQQLTKDGYIHGFSDGTYRPSAPVTRGQLLAYFMNAVETITGVTPGANSQTYSDVAPGNWAFNFVGAASGAGWLNPYWIGVRPGYAFHENYQASWGDAASYFVSSMEQAGKVTLPKGVSPLQYIQQIGLLQGIPSADQPAQSKHMDRADAAVFLSNVLAFANGQLLPTGATVTVTGSTYGSVGTVDNLNLTVKDSMGNTITLPSTAAVSWSVDNSNGLINHNNQPQAQLVATAPGVYNVTATVDGVPSAQFAVTVAGAAAKVNVTTGPATLVAGQSGVMQAVYANVYDANGVPVPNPVVTFSSSNSNIASVTGTTYQGVVGQVYTYVTPGNEPGVATITANSGTVSSSAQVTVATNASKVTISGNNSVAVGSNETLTASLTDLMGNALTVASDVVPQWTVTGTNAANASVSSNGVFTATQPGTYTVDVNYDGVSSTANVIAYGQASAVKITPASATLTANGVSTDALNVSVNDANGTVVSNFNGNVSVVIPTSLGTLANGTISGSNSTAVVAITNGQGTVTLTAPATPTSVQTISAETLSTTNNSSIASTVTYGTATVTPVAQTATAVKVVIPQANIAANSSTGGTVQAEVLDQSGQPMLSGSYQVQFTVSSNATLSNAASDGSYTTTFIGSGVVGTTNYATATVNTKQGVTGAISVKAVSGSLTAGTGTLNAVITGAASGMTANLSASSFVEGSTGVTLNLQAVDSNGYPIANPDRQVYVNVMNGSSQATNIEVNGTALSSSYPNGLPVTIGANGSAAITLVDTNGGADAANYTVTVSPLSGATNAFKAVTLPLSETAATASKVAVTSTVNYVPSSAPTTTITAQVEDQYGNALSTSGIPVTFTPSLSTATVNGLATATVNTNSTGKASVTLALPSSTGSTSFVTATATNLTGGISPSVTVESNVVSTASVSLQDTSSGNYLNSTSVAQAGDTITGTINLKDAAGNAGTTADTVQVTFSPSSGVTSVTNLTPTSTAGVYTATVTGSLTFTAVASTAGPVTATVVDQSLTTAPTGSATMTVVPGTPSQYGVFYNGNNVNTADGNYITVNSSNVGTPIPVWVYATDSQGNKVTSNGNVTVTLTAADDTGSVPANNVTGGVFTFRSSTTGVDTASGAFTTTVPAGANGVEVYLLDNNAKVTGNSAEYVNVSATASTAPTLPDVNASTVTATATALSGGASTVTVSGVLKNANGQAITSLPSGYSLRITPQTNSTGVLPVYQTPPVNSSGAFSQTFAANAAGTVQFVAAVYNASNVLVETLATEPSVTVSSLITPIVEPTETLHGIQLVANNNATATSYKIWRTSGPLATNPINTSVTPYATVSAGSGGVLNYLDGSVSAGTQYNYEVEAVDTNGAVSSASSVSSIEYGTTVVTTPNAVLTAANAVKVSFDALPGSLAALLANSATASDFSVNAAGSAVLIGQTATVNSTGGYVTVTFGSNIPTGASISVTANAVGDAAGVANTAGIVAITNQTFIGSASVAPSATAYVAGTVQPLVFTFKDQYGNPIVNQAVTFGSIGTLSTNFGTSTTAASDTTAAASVTGVTTNSSGQATIYVADTNASHSGTVTATVTVNGSSLTLTSGTVTITPAAVASVTAVPTTNTPVAGVNDPISLTALDQYGNTVTGFTGAQSVTVAGQVAAPNGTFGTFNGTTLTTSSQSVSVSFTNGVASNVGLTLTKAAAQTLTFAFDGKTSSNVTITPTVAILASMSGLTYGSKVGGPVASASETFAVATPASGVDAYGNTAVTTGGTYSISSPAPTTGVTINSSTGAISAVSGGTTYTGSITVTYTVGLVTTTATVTIV